MKKFLNLSKPFYGPVIIAIFLLLFLGFAIYLVNSGKNKQRQHTKQHTSEILSNKNHKAQNKNTTPSISIVVIELGLDKSLFEKAMNLPKKVTLGFSPYSPYLDYILELAQKEKRDIIMNIPTDTLLLETADYSFQDNGPYALVPALEDSENSKRLNFIISKAKGFSGYYTSINDSFTDTVKDLTFLLNELKESNQYIMYNDRRKVKPFMTIATKFNMQNRIIKADILLDSKLERSEIKSGLDELKNIADAYGHAIGIVRAYHISIDQVDKWLKEVDQNLGYNIVSLSELVNSF